MATSSRSDAALSGLRAALPLAVPVIPFGLILGFAITQTPISNFTGWSSSWTIFGGASQLAAINLFAEEASALVIVTTVVVINARHFLYSAALNERVKFAPIWFRIVASYILIDQVFAIVEGLPEVTTKRLMWVWLGAGSSFFLIWQASVAAGVLVGDFLPTSWSLSFVVPLLFGGLMVLSIRNAAGLAAAIVGGIVAVAASDLPQGSGLIVAIVAGVATAALVDRRTGAANA